MDNESNNAPKPFAPQESQGQPGSQGQQAPQDFMPQQLNSVSSPMQTPSTSSPKNTKILTIALVVLLVVAAIACCAAFVIPNISSGNKSQSGSSTNSSESSTPNSDSDEPSEQDVKPVGATIEDGKWEVTFPGYTSGDLTVYNETYGFTLPAGVTDVASTMIDQTKSNDTFEYKINSLTTTTGNYDAQTVCGHTDNTSKIALAGLIRQPAPAAEPVVNGNTITSVTMLSTDDVYTLYLWLGLEDDSGKCNLDSAKSDKAHELINELLGLSFAE